VILPSATDLHVHFRDPGESPSTESFVTGTAGAARGGVALVADMPNTVPPVTRLDHLEEKAARAKGRIAIDVSLFAALEDTRHVASLARRAAGFKLYLSPTTGIEPPPETEPLGGLLASVADSGLSLSVHAEDPKLFPAHLVPRTTPEWDSARPGESELRAIDRLLPAPPALRLNVAHVTMPATVDRLHDAGHSFEASPHHLLLSARQNQNARFKVNPPLRAEAVRSALWERFREGKVPILASDHAPHPLDEKERPFPLAPSGVPGVETMLPLMLAKVRAGELTLPVLLAAACERPASWLGAAHGRIAPGWRGNLIVVDFRARRPVRARELASPCGWSPFESMEAIFPTEHYLDGRRIVENGETTGTHLGRVVRPEYAGARPG
ncbi:MAG: hypothetical protein L3K09_07560, partial [Thermoplasmata archaeon]|nr:hypothetical protein [Thermoplasmata archaeon]